MGGNTPSSLMTMTMNKYQFAFERDGHIKSSMACEISENSQQLLTFYEYSPILDRYTEKKSANDTLSEGLKRTVPIGTYHDWYCGWFPYHPNSWCEAVFGVFAKHEYSDFLNPPELQDLSLKMQAHLR